MVTKPDKPLLWLVRQGDHLIGASEYDRDWIQRYPATVQGGNLNVINCYLHQPVDPVLTRKFHAMINWLAKGIDEEFHGLKNRLMAAAGGVTSYTHIEGLGISVRAKGWSELEGPEALEVYNRVVMIIAAQYLPHMRESEIKRKVEQYAGLSEVQL